MGAPGVEIFEFYIRATPAQVWDAVTDPAVRARYHFGLVVDGRWTPGARVSMGPPGAPGSVIVGEVLEVDPPHRLVHTMVALWSDEVRSEGPSRVTWQLAGLADSCHLTLTHDHLRPGGNPQIYGGWPMILSGLKTWLETGERLTTPGSLLYDHTG